MTDQTAGGVGSSLMQFFSPPVLTALRYALAALGPLFAMAGFAVLSPTQINNIITMAQQVGTAVAAIVAFIGIVGPLAASAFGTFKSTQAQQIKSASDIATGPGGPVAVEAQKAIIAGVNAIAQDPSIPKSAEAKVALLDATAALPEVVGKINVTDDALVQSTESNQIQKAT